MAILFYLIIEMENVEMQPYSLLRLIKNAYIDARDNTIILILILQSSVGNSAYHENNSIHTKIHK